MLCKIIVCLLITYRFESVQCKAWPDQYKPFDYNDPSQRWGNPYYQDNYGRGEFRSEQTTSTTTKPLYPTLYPRYQPSAPVPESARFPAHAPFADPREIGNDHQRQVPVNPFGVLPLHPTAGGHRNHSSNGRHDYNDNNFNYPYDNTRTTTYPPFDGATKRPTFPTRRYFSNFPSATGTVNNTIQRPINPVNPLNPVNPVGQTTPPPPFNSNNNQQNYGRNTPFPNAGVYNQNHNNSGSSSFRPFPNPSQLNNQGNLYQNQQNNQPNNGNPYQNQPNNQLNSGSQYTNQPTYQPNRDLYQNQPNQPLSSRNQFPNPTNYQPNKGNQTNNSQNIGSQYPNQQNYQSNSGNSNHGIYPTSNLNSMLTSQTSSQTSSSNQKPDYDPNGVALAPFPGDTPNPNTYGNRPNFNYGNLQHRSATYDNMQSTINAQSSNNFQKPQQPDLNSRMNSYGPSQVPLAGYTGAHVPLA